MKKFYWTLIIAALQSNSALAEQISITSNPSAPISALKRLTSMQKAPIDSSPALPKIQLLSTTAQTPAVFVQRNELPMVDIQLIFAAGSSRDSEIAPQLSGLASITGRLLDEGTSKYSADEIAQRFSDLGADYSIQARRDTFVVSLRVLADDQYLLPAIALLTHIIADANFPQKNIDRIFDNAQVGQKQVKESPSRMAQIRFFRELYGTHPYAEPTTGTTTSLKKIQPKDLNSFKNKFLVHQNMNMAITGRLTLAKANLIANQIIQQIPAGQTASVVRQPKALQSSRIVHIAYPSSQTHIIMGHLGIARNNSDRFALEVANEMLGGNGFTSLLTQELREKRGFTYGAYSSFLSMQTQGPFSLSYSTRADQTLPSLQVAHRTLLNFIHSKVDQNQLQQTKSGILRSFPQLVASNASINNYLAASTFYKLPIDYLSRYSGYINAVTTSDIERVSKQYIHPDKLLTIIVGPEIDTEQVTKIYNQNLKDFGYSVK